MSQKEIEERAYFLHIEFPNNSSETNWYIAETEIKEKNNRNRLMNINNNSNYVIDFMRPNFYTTHHLKIDHYNKQRMELFKEKVYLWGMNNFFDVLKKLVDEFEAETN